MFYFAWISNGTTPFGVEHHRVDEEPVSFSLTQAEGEFAALVVELRNPHVSVLKSSRPQWVWFSYKDRDDVVTPLFRGKLTMVPENLNKEIISVEFQARPDDFVAQKLAFAETLKVVPFWDRVWVPVDHDNDPDVVLESRPALWHIDRVTNVVSISDINSGELGPIVLGESDLFDDAFSIAYDSEPTKRIDVSATVTWDQKRKGSIDITDHLLDAFAAKGSKKGQVSSYTGEGLESDWPLRGDDIGSGWKFGTGDLKLLSGDGITATYIDCPIAASNTNTTVTAARFYLWVFSAKMNLAYNTSRSRSEVLKFHVLSDVQNFDHSTSPDPESLDYSSDRIVSPIDDDGAIPLGVPWRRTYFGTDRGLASIEYLMSVCRARFLKSARAVNISFEAPFDTMKGITLKHDVTLSVSGLPQGVARGKVTSYTLALTDGKLTAAASIGCTVGRGSELPAVDTGVDSYVDDYVDNYQSVIGGNIQPIAGRISYTPPVVSYGSGGTVVDDGLDLENLSADNAIVSLVVTNGIAAQAPVCAAGAESVDAAVTALNKVHTTVDLTMVPLDGGPFEGKLTLTADTFMVPKTIDLET